MYELSMVVAHVKEGWMEAPGNLVAHIRVSPFYHERKKVSLLKIEDGAHQFCSPDPQQVPVVPLQ